MAASSKHDFINEALNRRRLEHRFRKLTPCEPLGAVTIRRKNRELINLSGNDYLGLSRHPEMAAAAGEYAGRYGTGSTASRLINGTFPAHHKLERTLASTFGWESALVFNSGFQANSSIIGTITDRHSLILADKLCHNSLLQGALSSRASFRRFEHNSTEDLWRKLEKAASQNYSRILVITESVFSMDGDRSDLKKVSTLTEKYGAWLFVDEAHAVGVYGKEGLGLTQQVPGVDMVLGTCGKAFGSFGAFLLCTSKVRDYLINFCPGFIYTTALPPPVIGSITHALKLIPEMNSERTCLHESADKMRKGIQEIGYSTARSDSQIIPIMVGGDQETLELSKFLMHRGFLATAIRPPTVPEGSARIRITLSSKHKKEHINRFLSALRTWTHE